MASLYKKPTTVTDPQTGEKQTRYSAKWWGRYRDASGREKRVPLAKDKTAAQKMLNDRVRKVERELAGLIDPFDEHLRTPLLTHLEAYERYLLNKGSNRDYVAATVHRAKSALTSCRFARIGDLSPSRIQQFLAERRQQGLSISTVNGYLRSIKMFSRWMLMDRRTSADPIAHMRFMNEDTDRRRIRRPHSPEELYWLIKSTEKAPAVAGLSGSDRCILYLIATYTGFRRSEIASIRTESFDFDGHPPTLAVEAGYSKRRKRDVIPLRADFAAVLKKWVQKKSDRDPDQRLLDVGKARTSEMVREDLARARQEWIEEMKTASARKARAASSFLRHVNERGHVVDFHALRKTFITNLSLSGVAPKTAQTLARHSDINLTMNTYTMLGMCDQASAVESLPAVPKV
jgi:integrase